MCRFYFSWSTITIRTGTGIHSVFRIRIRTDFDLKDPADPDPRTRKLTKIQINLTSSLSKWLLYLRSMFYDLLPAVPYLPTWRTYIFHVNIHLLRQSLIRIQIRTGLAPWILIQIWIRDELKAGSVSALKPMRIRNTVYNLVDRVTGYRTWIPEGSQPREPEPRAAAAWCTPGCCTHRISHIQNKQQFKKKTKHCTAVP